MKPSFIRYVFAHGLKVSMGLGGLALAALVVRLCGGFSVWTAISVVLVLPLGFMLGFFVVWPFILYFGSKLNGEPFQNGELVYIIVGRFRDCTGRIDTAWKKRNSVFVDLGEQTKENRPHEFWSNEICRATSLYEKKRIVAQEWHVTKLDSIALTVTSVLAPFLLMTGYVALVHSGALRSPEVSASDYLVASAVCIAGGLVFLWLLPLDLLRKCMISLAYVSAYIFALPIFAFFFDIFVWGMKC